MLELMPAPIEPKDENTFACTNPPRKKVRSLSDVRDGGREKSRVLGFSAKRASEARFVPHAGRPIPLARAWANELGAQHQHRHALRLPQPTLAVPLRGLSAVNALGRLPSPQFIAANVTEHEPGHVLLRRQNC